MQTRTSRFVQWPEQLPVARVTTHLALQPSRQASKAAGPDFPQDAEQLPISRSEPFDWHIPRDVKIRQAALTRKATPASRRRLVTELLQARPYKPLPGNSRIR